MRNCSQNRSHSNRALSGAASIALLVVAARLPAAESYVADIWIGGTQVAEVALNLERNAMGEITHLKAGTTLRDPGYAAFGFNQVSEQVWSEGRLQYFTSTSYSGEHERRIELNSHEGGVAGLADDVTVEFPLTAAPATVWCDYPARAGVLFDPVDAAALGVRVVDMGHEELLVAGQPVTTVRHEFGGDWTRTIWYAANGLMVKARFHEKGHDVQVQLRNWLTSGSRN